MGQAGRARDLRLFVPHVRHLLVGQGARGHGQGRRPRRDDLQALHGLQGLADGQRRGAVRLVPSLRRDRRDAARPRRKRRARRSAAEALSRQGRHRAGRPCAVATARSRGRGDQPRHHPRRPGRRAALCRAYLLHRRPRGDRPRAFARHARLRRAADPASRARRERVLQQGLGARGAPRHVAAVPRQAQPGQPVERPARRLAASGGDRPLLVHHPSEGARPRRLHQDPQRHRRPRRPHAGAVDLRRRHRPADDERIRRRHLDQHRPHPQHVSAQGRDPARRRRRRRRLGPQAPRRRSPPTSRSR